MNRTITIYIIILVLLMAGIIVIDSGRPKPINWTPTYALNDKIPFGLYILDKESKALFENQEVKKFSITPYEYFESLYDYEKEQYTAKGTFVSIGQGKVIDKESVNEMLYYTEHGNTVFLSMDVFPQLILDTLKLEVQNSFYYKDSIALSTAIANNNKYWFAEGINFSYFKTTDTLKTTVLGHQEIDTLKHINYIKVPFGKGNFLLHTQPAAFTNFHLLKSNHSEYASNIISYIPQGNIYWHAQQFQNSGVSNSPLRYILQQPALKWALYIGLIGLLVFIFFNAKRKQRIIPVKIPLKNTTVDFTKTIGNLYFQEGNHHTIIDKKIIYFLEKIRTEYLIDTQTLNEVFIDKLHQKTGSGIENIKTIIALIERHRHRVESTEKDVIDINKAIENLRL